jgi:hypothetical protein
MLSRRTFLANASLALLPLPRRAAGQVAAPTTRPNLAELDRLRILVAADQALQHPPVASRDFASDGWLAFTIAIPALAAAVRIDAPNAARYNAAAAAYLETWLLDPKTKPILSLPDYKPLVELAPLAETTVALKFFSLDPALIVRLKRYFTNYLKFLTEDTTALLARDAKDHHQSSWLLQVAAFSVFTGNDSALDDARHRFRAQFIRAQIHAEGKFPHEITGPYPYRDSLWNLDMLAGACMLLSTRFDSVWDTELQDGPGMRSAIAFHAPFIARRETWPYPADLQHFSDLPDRRPALVFAGHAYSAADYVTTWSRISPADPTDPATLRTFPIRQPILWLPQTKTAPR